MWTLHQTQPLNTSTAERSWLHPELLHAAAEVAERHSITGTQTLASIEPDEDGDFFAFQNTVESTITGQTVTTDYVLRDASEHVSRVATTAEVLAEMAHAAGFGDTVYVRELTTLVGDEDARALRVVGARHP